MVCKTTAEKFSQCKKLECSEERNAASHLAVQLIASGLLSQPLDLKVVSLHTLHSAG